MESAISDATVFSEYTSCETNEQVAVSGFLARYKGATRTLYALDLRIFFAWCNDVGITPLEACRAHLEMFARYLEEDRHNKASSVARRLHTLCVFYRVAAADGLIERDPAVMLRIPKVHRDPSAIAWLDRSQMGLLLRAAKDTSPDHEALVGLMGMLALRVSEACNVRIEDYAEDELGYRVLHLVGKGGKAAAIPVPIPVLRILERARDGRTTGWLIRNRAGGQLTRHGAYRWIKTLARRSGLPAAIHPHALRHGAVTAALDSGVDLRDAQVFARHGDPKMTMHYDRRRLDMDRHGAHTVARWFASAA